VLRRAFLAILAVALCLVGEGLAAAPAHATPQDLFGLGARSPALGMTGVSWSDNWEAVYTNPAGLARVRSREIAIGLGGGTYQLTLDNTRFPVEPPRGMTIGFQLPLPFGDVLQDRLVLAGGFYTPANVLLRGRVDYAEVPQWSVVDRAASLTVDVALGINLADVVPGLRLGIGITALANVVGDLTVRLDETNSFQSIVETQLLTSFSPVVGAALDQSNWGLGIVYRHEVRSEMNLHIRVEDLPVPLPTLTIGALVQYDPASLAIEGYYLPDPNVRIALNATMHLWSFYPGPYRPTSDGSYLPPAPGFHDTISPRISIEGTIHSGGADLVLRAGYALELSPSPGAYWGVERNSDGSAHMNGMSVVGRPLRILDNDRHIITAGFGIGYTFGGNERLHLDFWGQLHAMPDRSHEITATGTTAPDFMNPVPGLTTGGYIIVGGWILGIDF
jgi:long-chain fatty acid transport protein